MTNVDRYKAQPFLLLMDCYVLDAIGQLSPQQRAGLEKLEPKLQETFGVAGRWREVVEAQMGFMPTVALQIEMAWAAYQEHESSAGRNSSAGDFVRGFVAQNFPALLEEDVAAPKRKTTATGSPKRARKR